MRKSGNVMMKVKGKIVLMKEGMVNGLSNEWYSKVKRKGKNESEFSVNIKLSVLPIGQIF